RFTRAPSQEQEEGKGEGEAAHGRPPRRSDGWGLYRALRLRRRPASQQWPPGGPQCHPAGTSRRWCSGAIPHPARGHAPPERAADGEPAGDVPPPLEPTRDGSHPLFEGAKAALQVAHGKSPRLSDGGKVAQASCPWPPPRTPAVAQLYGIRWV